MTHGMKMYSNQSVIWSIGRDIPTLSKLVQLSVDESYAVFAGMKTDGKTEVIILNSTNGDVLETIRIGSMSASVLTFSPDNKFIYLGG